MNHIEGIAGEFFYKNVVKKGIRNTGITLKNSEKLVLYMLNVIGDVQNLDPKIIGFMGWIMVKSIVEYAQRLYKFVDFEQNFEKVQKSSTLHRHGSAHGIQLGFPTAMNSLRLFLLFDTIHYMLKSYENHGKVIWI